MIVLLLLGEHLPASALTASRVDNSQTQQHSHLPFVGFSLTGTLSSLLGTFAIPELPRVLSPQIKKGIQLSRLSITNGEAQASAACNQRAAGVTAKHTSFQEGQRQAQRPGVSRQTGPAINMREGLCLPTAGAGTQAAFQAKRKNHLGKIQMRPILLDAKLKQQNAANQATY